MFKSIRLGAAVLLCIALITTTLSPVFAATDYDNHWAKDSIKQAVSAGFVKGYPDGTFKPENNVTRAEFVVMANKIYKYPSKIGAHGYKDVPENLWFSADASASYNEFVTPYNEKYQYFRPNDYITRAEMGRMIGNAEKSFSATNGTWSFPDPSGLEFGEESLVKTVKANIMGGYPDGTFMGNAPVKRAEAVVVLIRAMKVHNGETLPALTAEKPETPQPESSPVVAEVTEAFKKHVETIEKEDLEAHLQTISIPAESVEPSKAALKKLFDLYDIAYKIESFSVESYTDTTAIVKVAQTTTKISGPEFNNNHTVTLHYYEKIDGKWKIVKSENQSIEYID